LPPAATSYGYDVRRRAWAGCYHRPGGKPAEFRGNQALVTGCKTRENKRAIFFRVRPFNRSQHMKFAFRRSALVAAFALAAAAPAFAHHSFSIFSMDKNVTYKG